MADSTSEISLSSSWMRANDYSAEEEYEISLQLLGHRYNDALDKIDSLNAIVADLMNIMHMYGIPVPQKI